MRILYLYNLKSNNPGNSALFHGCRNIMNCLIGEHESQIFDLDILAYRKIEQANFVDVCNQYDYVVVSGLVIFNGQIHYSRTGSKIDIDIEYLSEINSKFILLGVSSIVWEGGKGNRGDYHHIDKLKDFLKFVRNKKNFYMFYRDDDSSSLISELIGDKTDFEQIIDPAIFEFYKLKNNEKKKSKIFVNLNGEDFEERFPDGTNQLINPISEAINNALDNKKFNNVVLQPHSPEDLYILSLLSEKISPFHYNRNLEIGGLPSSENWKYVYERYYSECSLLISMRIHSINPACAMGVPTICVPSSRRIYYFANKFLTRDHIFEPQKDKNLELRVFSPPKMNEVRKKINIECNKAIDKLKKII